MIWNAFGRLLPLLFGLLLYALFKRHPRFEDFSNGGEFAIYSSTLLAIALSIVFKEYRTLKFPSRGIFGGISILFLLAASALYLCVVMIDTANIQVEFNRNLMRSASLVLYLASFVLTSVLAGLDRCRDSMDWENEGAQQIKKLERNFDTIGDN